MRGDDGEGWPEAAERVLRRVVPSEDVEVAVGELREGWRSLRDTRGNAAARRWLWRQVWGFAWRAVAVRRATTRTDSGRSPMGGLDAVWADVRWAVRGLRKRPGFTAVAALTLALGIGANTAVFMLVNAHFFESLPYEDPDGLVLLWETGRNNTEVTTVAPGNYWSWREDASSFAEVAAYNVDFATLSGEDAAERVSSAVVTPHFFQVLGARPTLGTVFSEASVREDGDQVVLSHSLWTRRYGADPDIVGARIRIDGRPHTVAGVLPSSFRQPERSLSWQATELWRPMLLEERRSDHGSRYLRAVARLAPGVTVEQARDEMTALSARLREAWPEANAGRSALVYTLDEYLLSDARPVLLMLLMAGGAVLLIVCANIANLTLARGEERQREFAVRAALGSGGGRLVRQIVVEGVVLALLGAALGTVGVFIAAGVLQDVQATFFSGLVDVAVDLRVIAVTTVGAIAAGVLFGLPLARTASAPDLRGALISGSQRGGGRSSDVTRSLLVVGQVGLATSLLVVAALLSRSFAEMVNVPPGFESDRVVTFTVAPPRAGYEDREDILRYHETLRREVESIAGVAGVGTVSDLMFTTENMFTTLEIPGLPADPENRPRAEYHVIGPGYFEVLQIPVLAGTLPDHRPEGDEVPVVINQRMAEVFWPDEDPLGRTAMLEWADPSGLRVVAVVDNVLDDGYVAEPEPIFYLPFEMLPRRRMSYLVKGAPGGGDLLEPLREAVARIDPDIPAGDLQMLDGMLAESVSRPRAASMIGLSFAVIALLVSAAGIYGVLAYSVERRTRELGIRAALGAARGDLVSMVMRWSTRLVVLGLAIGTLGALLAGRRLAGLLFGVPVWDPVSLLVAVVVLGGVGLLASWMPARRAARIHPREALRME